MRKITDVIKDKSFTMGSHLPVLKTILESFRPSGILELGVGLKSTELLYNSNKTLYSIETDKEWHEKITALHPTRENFHPIYHELKGIALKTKFHQLNDKKVEPCIQFYRGVMSKDTLDFLFVDHVSGLRIYTLKALFKDFRYIAFHDAQRFEKQYWKYGYPQLLNCDLHSYHYFITESLGVGTGVLLHKDYDLKVFKSELKSEERAYCKQFDVEYQPVFISPER